MQHAMGSYTGNGTSQSVTLGFQPDLVLVRGDSTHYWCALGSMAAGNSRPIGLSQAPATGAIAITATGFDLGSDANVNTNAVVYHYWACKVAAADGVVSSYTGNGTSQTISGLGITPDFVLVLGAGATVARFKTSDMSGANSAGFTASGLITIGITALGAGSFSVGSDASVNTNGTTYSYIALANVAGFFKTLSYTTGASPADNTSVTGVGFQPDFTAMKTTAAVLATGRFQDQVGDASFDFTTTAVQADRIQAFEADGFQIGLSSRVNSASTTYYTFSAKEGTSPAASSAAVPSSNLLTLGVG